MVSWNDSQRNSERERLSNISYFITPTADRNSKTAKLNDGHLDVRTKILRALTI